MSRTSRWLLIGGGLLLLTMVGCVGIYLVWIRPLVAAGIPGVTVKTVVLEGRSMEPTFKQGARLQFRPYRSGTALQRGDIIIYQDPGRPSRLLLHRVIALAGEQVELRQGSVYINGTALQEPYAAAGTARVDLPPLGVPPDHVWVLGDNRNASLDSRMLGPIPLAQVQGVWAGR